MSIYKVTTPTGAVRIVEAPVQKSALNHVVKADYEIEPLSATQLAAVLRENPDVTIEQVTSTTKDEAQLDVEDSAKINFDDNGEE
jgi:hypothetical protein